jgi:cytochrome P450
MLMLDFLPNLTASKAHIAREKLQAAFRAYFHAGYDLDDDVSPFIKSLTAVQRSWGLDNDHQGNFAIAMLMASTTNAVPSIFWFIVYVFSQSSLIEEIREEVMRVTTSKTNDKGVTSMIIDVSKFQQQCPLLCSTCQEVMRVSNKQISFRAAVDDTTISSSEGKFSLQKDSVVFMPSSLHHTSTGVWGHDSGTFNARRFMKQDLPAGKKSTEAKEAEKLQKKAFFPFGAGRHYCPGRYFAFTEMVAVVSVLTVGFDIVMDDGEKGGPGGSLRVPQRYYRSFGEAIPKPVEKMNVYMRRRKDFEDVNWVLDVGNIEDKE